MRTKLTDRNVKRNPPTSGQLELWDTVLPGFGLRISYGGKRAYCLMVRINGKQRRLSVGNAELIGLAEARDKARAMMRDAAKGLDPVAAEKAARAEAERDEAESFETVFESYMDRYVKRQQLRSAPEIERAFRVCVLPTWKDRAFLEIKRGDVARLLDDIEDNRGPVMADRTLAYLSKMFNWYASREDDYVSPIVRGMARTKPRERARDRKLSDDEIRLLWAIWQDSGPFGALLQIALLTGQRRAKVVGMRWQDVDLETGVWTIPAEKREKNNPGSLTLPPTVLDIIRVQPVIKGNAHVFAGRGAVALSNFAKRKAALDNKITEASGAELRSWTIHDLRRTAKSLMIRAGVRPDISERVLGHVIGGVEGTYDRHDYEAEKADALVKLAGLVDRITTPPAGNVVALHG